MTNRRATLIARVGQVRQMYILRRHARVMGSNGVHHVRHLAKRTCATCSMGLVAHVHYLLGRWPDQAVEDCWWAMGLAGVAHSH